MTDTCEIVKGKKKCKGEAVKEITLITIDSKEIDVKLCEYHYWLYNMDLL
jgi:hypothetical protein